MQMHHVSGHPARAGWQGTADLVLLAMLVSSPVVAQQGDGAGQSGVVFLRGEEVWAVTLDGSRTLGPFTMGGHIDCLTTSPDGRYLACTTSPHSGVRVYQVSSDGTLAQVAELKPGLVDITCHMWSPDGRYLAVGTIPAAREGPDGKPLPGPEATPDDALLRSGDADGSSHHVHILPWHPVDEGSPNRKGGGEPLRSAAIRPLPASLRAGLAWAPDSSWMAWVRPGRPQTPSRPDTICKTDLATALTTDLAPTDTGRFGHILELTGSPDGKWLAYICEQTFKLSIFGSDGSAAPRPLTCDGDDGYFDLCWSPSGSLIAFTRPWGQYLSGRAYGVDLWVRNLESGQATDLTNHKTLPTQLGWSRDGSQVVFHAAHADRDEYGDLYTADPATSVIKLPRRGCDPLPSEGGVGGGWGIPIQWLAMPDSAKSSRGDTVRPTDTAH